MTSPCLEEAIEILDRAKGSPLSVPERKRLAIELVSHMLYEASRAITPHEKKIQEQLAELMRDPTSKAFTIALTNDCFRSRSNKRIADQITYLTNKIGLPQYFDVWEKTALFIFRSLGPGVAQFFVPFVTRILRKEASLVILPGERASLNKHLEKRKVQNVPLNLNHLGESVFSESEAKRRLTIYLEDLKHPGIHYISVKISTIFSQINLIDFEGTVDTIANRLQALYRAAIKHPTIETDGTRKAKFINLDMEEYRDLHLTVAAFKKVLGDPEFFDYSAGIALQAYLPDSYNIQKELTEWAKQRVRNGGAPIKIRIVKGANLAMEQLEASLKGWPQAIYGTKVETDANFKRMVIYGCIPENARAARLGIGSHNLFEIAFAMLLRLENEVEPYVSFEMLEGMADHIRRIVQKLTGNVLLYCPVATRAEFQHAIAYLIRCLDENTGPEHFLRYAFGLKPGSDAWDNQISLFSQSCDEINTVSALPRRTQNRLKAPVSIDFSTPFENEPDTDFSLPQNRKWAEEILRSCPHKTWEPLPIVVGGTEVFANADGVGHSPSAPQKPLFHYAKASKRHIEEALSCSKKQEQEWAETTLEHRSRLLARAAQLLRERRGDLVGAMIVEGGKTIEEADPEVSESIDFAEYYRWQMAKLAAMKDIKWKPKGTVCIVSPWNFPCSIPAGGILAALMTGNCVLFKPSSKAVVVGWLLANALWDAGTPKEVLQFVPCSGEENGGHIIGDPRINCVIFTGSTETASHFLKMRPDLNLAAETGGKNAIIVTALADRDLAVKNLIQSAFGHSGQKCSAASLAILEAEVYDSPRFKKMLREAAASLKVGLSWDPATKINPLIHEPQKSLKRALTTLEPGEEWLLEPKQDSENPSLWSPGIKWNVQPKSFTCMTEFFGPVLAVLRANDLHHAIQLANDVPYGLTSGLQSLDDREHEIWLEKIEAGNLYINRTITGAIVRRQPFGGTKASHFGNGLKSGGPNYLNEFMIPSQVGLPQEKSPVNEWVNNLTAFLAKLDLTAEQLGLWTSSVSNYAYWWKRMSHDRDPTKIVGEDNLFRYVPRQEIVLRLEPHSKPLDALRVCAAGLTCGAGLEISWSHNDAKPAAFNWLELVPVLRVTEESDQEFLIRVREGKIQRIRLVEPASAALQTAAAACNTHVIDVPVLANGRLELLHFLREITVSIDYHRYGHLGMREGELRKPIL